MSPKLRSWLIALLCLLVLIGLLITLIPTVFIPNLARKSFPQVEGEIKLPGLDAAVDVYRDDMGIPHIYASTMHDLFEAQGFIHAQDRFWQMDFWRHIGSGRLAEMFGESQVETDSFLRTLGWRQIAEQEFSSYTSESKAILEAYSEGVNAYLAQYSGAQLSLEYAVLGLLNPDYQPEPWTPVHSLTWGKVMAWDLGGNMDLEIERSILMKTLTPAQIADLYPDYPSDHPVIVPEIGEFAKAEHQAFHDLYRHAYVDILPIQQIETIFYKQKLIEQLIGKTGIGIGSNSWAIAGQNSITGMPILANDPHLGIQMPSIWYQISLHCRPKSDRCPFQVAGFSFAGVPGVIIGHNEHLAWGFTNVGPDVMDLYIEKINPQNPNQYEVNGQWLDMQLHDETIDAGDKPVIITVRSTRHGPLISDTYASLKQTVTPDPDATQPPLPYQEKAGIDLPENYAIALRWTALEPSYIFEAIWGFNKAKNWDEFRESARLFNVPAQNLIYADIEGNIAYQMPGNIPIRNNGDGQLPVPGWTDEYEWNGYIPFDELPYTLNPPQGYIVTANNQVHPHDYPYLVTSGWDFGYRAQRIQDMIANTNTPIDIAYIQSMQGDNYNMIAEVLVPILVQLNDPSLDANHKLLADWDYQDDMDSQKAALFEYFWHYLLKDTFTDEEIPEDYWPGGDSRWFEIMRKLIQQPTSPWWDDKNTEDTVETRDQTFIVAFNHAVSTITEEYGKDSSKWPTWGELHTATFRNATLGESGIRPIENLFNRGPFQTAGGDSIVNATGWNIMEPFELVSLPSMRMIVDLADLRNSFTVHTTGQSGHAYHPHYIDMADLWRNIQYYPMYWNEQAIISAAENHLLLLP